MARFKYCKDCGQKVSKSARTCEMCGAHIKITWNELGKSKKILVAFILLLFVLVLALVSQA